MQQHTHDEIPLFLCRRCNPARTLTADERAALERQEREARAKEREREKAKRDLLQAQQRISTMTYNGEPSPQSVNGKVLASLRRKVTRLQKQQEG